jgi:hypothetical protein
MNLQLTLTAPLSHPGGVHAHGVDTVCQEIYIALRTLGYSVGPMDAHLEVRKEGKAA